MGLFEGQSSTFFSTLMELAVRADNARRRVEDEDESFDEFLERFFDKD